MKKTGIFYGSSTGTTREVAKKLGEALGVDSADIFDVAVAKPSDLDGYDLILFGCSTWGAGDMQDDMHDFLDGVQAIDLSGKEIALFGCGDENMSSTFCDGVGEMRQMLIPTRARFLPGFPADDYNFRSSKAVIDGRVVGLLIDQANHPALTDSRIQQWAKIIKAEE